nr:hypothetical protein [Tanacetum cinerariifolium]
MMFLDLVSRLRWRKRPTMNASVGVLFSVFPSSRIISRLSASNSGFTSDCGFLFRLSDDLRDNCVFWWSSKSSGSSSEELKDLWGGVETFDACARENFKLKAAILSTISDFPGKVKRQYESTTRITEISIRKELYPPKNPRSNNMYKPKACYEMTRAEKDVFLQTIKSIKPPDEYSSNISRGDIPSLHKNEVDGDDEIDVTESMEDEEEEEEDTY